MADGALCVVCVEAQPRQEAVPHAEVMLVHNCKVAPQHEVVSWINPPQQVLNRTRDATAQ